MIACIAETI